MNKSFCLNLALTTALGITAANGLAAEAKVLVQNLRCEYRENPVAPGAPGKNPVDLVDTAKPRLSWVVQSTAVPPQRGLRQTAYQVLVADSLAALDKNTGNLWDSGKVVSDQSTQVEYAGKPLASAQDCYWKVRVWDQDGNVSPYSQPSRWTMGLLEAGDWKAQWIGFDGDAGGEDPLEARINKLASLSGCKWMWAPDAAAGNQAVGEVYFRKVISLPPMKIQKAVFVLTADDGFTLYVNGQEAAQGNSWRNLVRVDVTNLLKPGNNALAIRAANGGNSPSPAGVVGKLAILLEGGQATVQAIDESWLASRQAAGDWRAVAYDNAGWTAPKAVANFGAQPWGEVKLNTVQMLPAPYFRKDVTLGKPVKRALLFASALGLYELHLNGKPVSNDVFGPGWTDYRKRVHYFAYDVTNLLQPGQNTIGALLGDGWYAAYLAFTGKRNYYGEKTRLLAQMLVEYQDGTREVIGTDGSWKATYGPVREGDLLMGCVYDARLEMPGWDAAGFDDSKWRPAVADGAVKANLQAHPAAPIRRMKELPAQSLKEPKPGVYVFDLGQNMVGWARVRLKGAAGQKVTVRHAEMLNPDGTIYTTNLRAAKATDTYYLAGGEARAYEPYFTFHGFQYVEITGLDYKPAVSDVTGIVVYSDLPEASSFECSEPLVNKLVRNTVWGQMGNFLDVPTDCPQRDERAGWTGDAQVFMKAASFNLDGPAFWTKWLIDLCEDSQNDQGGFGDVAPHISIVGFGNTGWADSGLVCNWRMYELYGDTRVIARHYPALERYMAYLARTSKEFVRGTGAYGDWLRLAGPQHSDAIGTAYYFHSARLMSQLAAAIGKRDDAAKYAKLAEDIKGAFVAKFLKEDGRIVDSKNQTGQTLYALAFGLDLVPAARREAAAAQFAEEIKKQNGHLATGFLGTPFVLFALQKAGRADLAYQLVLNKTYPSWLQQVIWGSTTMWERWDGWRPDKGFQDPGMNSFNHYWLGCVGEWLYTAAAGIDTEGPGFKRVSIRPTLDPSGKGLSFVKASYQSLRGKIVSDWKLDGPRFTLNVVIPGNTTATVYVPAKDAAQVTEGGKPARQAAGVRFLRLENGVAVYEVGSGQYQFASTL